MVVSSKPFFLISTFMGVVEELECFCFLDAYMLFVYLFQFLFQIWLVPRYAWTEFRIFSKSSYFLLTHLKARISDKRV